MLLLFGPGAKNEKEKSVGTDDIDDDDDDQEGERTMHGRSNV